MFVSVIISPSCRNTEGVLNLICSLDSYNDARGTRSGSLLSILPRFTSQYFMPSRSSRNYRHSEDSLKGCFVCCRNMVRWAIQMNSMNMEIARESRWWLRTKVKSSQLTSLAPSCSFFLVSFNFGHFVSLADFSIYENEWAIRFCHKWWQNFNFLGELSFYISICFPNKATVLHPWVSTPLTFL